MSKGGGTQTVTQANPTQSAQLPHLQDTWNQAKQLYQNNPLTPYSSLANTVARWGQPEREQSYQSLYDTSQSVAGMNPMVQGAYGSVLGARGDQNPAWAYYNAYAGGNARPVQNFQALGDQATQSGAAYANQAASYAAPTSDLAWRSGANNNLGLSQLGNTASGTYLNANPYLNEAIRIAQRPVTENYQTSIAPSMDAALAAGGRYGSGAQQGLYGQAQAKLAQGLGDISGRMSEANYARERAAQDQAAQQYGSLYNQGLSNAAQMYQNAAGQQTAAADQYWRGQTAAQNAAQQQMAGQQYGSTGLAGLWNQGQANQLSALGQFPALAQGLGVGGRMGAEAGTGMASIQQALINEENRKWDEMIQQPYKELDRYSGYVGNPQSGSVSTPYHTNQFAEMLSGLTGVASLGKNLGLFGGGSGGGSGGGNAWGGYSGSNVGPYGDYGSSAALSSYGTGSGPYGDYGGGTDAPSWSGMSGGGGGGYTTSGGGDGGLGGLGGILGGIGSIFRFI